MKPPPAPHDGRVAGVSRRERDKGRKGESEVRQLLERYGFHVHAGQRNLAGTSDTTATRNGVTLHVECKRQETARPWAWIAQAEADAADDAIPLVAFRRSHGRWYALLPLEDLADVVSAL